jgi:hypothetical protein
VGHVRPTPRLEALDRSAATRRTKLCQETANDRDTQRNSSGHHPRRWNRTLYRLSNRESWSTESEGPSAQMVGAFRKIVVDYLRSSDPVDLFSLYCLSLFPNVFRFALSIIFVGSFLLKPVVMRPVNLVWRRVVESDKPVFTVMFGGAAAFATAISEAAKHLSG